MSKFFSSHQLFFFPWLGFFNRIYKSDVFVLLDDVRFQKSSSGTWSNRVMLNIGAVTKYFMAPIKRQLKGLKKKGKISFLENNDWRRKLIETIEINYKKGVFFKDTRDLIEPLILFENNNLLEYNTNFITSIVNELGLSVEKIKLSSVIGSTGKSNDRLLSIEKLLDADTYLCGQGLGGYINENVSIDIIMQDTNFKIYKQNNKNTFILGLSVIGGFMFASKENVI